MDIALNFINRSDDVVDSQIVICGKNPVPGGEKGLVAWQVIRECAPGDNHPFVYSMTMQVNGKDNFGNYTPLLEALPGQLFAMTRESVGDVMKAAGRASSYAEVQVKNGLPEGDIEANIYRSGKRFAAWPRLAPQQTAAFVFKPVIWIGVVSQMEEGEILNSAVMSAINTEISLLGITSADIVMTGGGAGPKAKPFAFFLENIAAA